MHLKSISQNIPIPFFSFRYCNEQIRKQVLDAFEKVFDSQQYILNEQVSEFEKNYAAFNSTKFAIGVSNGLDALHLALSALNIGAGDEVIVPSNTYIATVLAISYAGASPVFVEPNLQTYNIDPEQIEKNISEKTKAIIPVHLYGQSCEMEPIMQIAKKYSLHVIEDNAQGHGAAYKNKLTGSFGNINATSFYPTKNLGALGDAGALTCDDDALARKAATLRNYGSGKKYFNAIAGYNNRLDEIQAAILNIKLGYLSEWTKQRQFIASLYSEELQGTGDIILPHIAEYATHVFHIYLVRTNKREALQHYLLEHGIGTAIHYPVPVHLQKAYAYLNYKKGDFPVAEEIADTCLSLPVWPGLTNSEIKYICRTILDFFTSHA